MPTAGPWDLPRTSWRSHSEKGERESEGKGKKCEETEREKARERESAREANLVESRLSLSRKCPAGSHALP